MKRSRAAICRKFEVVYLFVDGIAERLHLGQPREAVLAAWGILADGKKALLHLAPGPRRTRRVAWSSSAICAGAACPTRRWWPATERPGLSAPLRNASRVRCGCVAHKMRNLASKVPEDLWPEFKAHAVACYQAASPALAQLLRDDIKAAYAKDLPSAVACLEDDFEACIAYLRFPIGHRRTIRTTNLLERLFGRSGGAPK